MTVTARPLGSPDDAYPEYFTGRFVIGADGARSAVRRHARVPG